MRFLKVIEVLQVIKIEQSDSIHVQRKIILKSDSFSENYWKLLAGMIKIE